MHRYCRHIAIDRYWVRALTAIMVCALVLGGCGQQPTVAEYSIFGDPGHTEGIFAYDGDVLVVMEPKDRAFRREGLSIEGFRSPTGSKGEAFIHYPKGRAELRLVVYDVNKATSDMTYEWEVVQIDKWKVVGRGRVVQEMQVRIVPGPPVKVFVDGRKITVSSGGQDRAGLGR